MLTRAAIPVPVTYIPYRARKSQTISTLETAPLMLRELSSSEAPVAITMEHARRPGVKHVRRIRGSSLFAPLSQKGGAPPLRATELTARLGDPHWVARYLNLASGEADSTLPAKVRHVIEDGGDALRSATAALSRIIIVDGYAYRPALEPAFLLRSFLRTWSVDTAAPLQRRNASVGVHFSIQRPEACLEALRKSAHDNGEEFNDHLPVTELLTAPCWPMFPEAIVNARNLLYELKGVFSRHILDYVLHLERVTETTEIERMLQSALSPESGEEFPAEAIRLAERILTRHPNLDRAKIDPFIKAVASSADFSAQDEALELADLTP